MYPGLRPGITLKKETVEKSFKLWVVALLEVHEYCQQVQTNVITHWLYLLSTAGESECANSSLEKEGPLWGSLLVLPSI